MPLGSPKDEIFWKDYQIDTPTFQLTPIEKPDMSPFLFHMTGENHIKNILQSGREGYGYLKANIPEAAQDLLKSNISISYGYNAPVVCFTESPTFALDFFRYRSYRRWKDDQRFGIGFDKATLVKNGIRPVFYVDKSLLQNLIELYSEISNENSNYFALIDEEFKNKIVWSVKTIYPLLFPLMEKHKSQGFMWEREWRYINPEGFYFSYNDIKVICCPEDEEGDIRDCFRESANTISFVRAWDEYDDVTDYLKRQKILWQHKQQKIQNATASQNLLTEYENIKSLVQQYRITSHTLAHSQNFLNKLQQWQQNIIEQKTLVEQEINKQEERLKEIEIQRFGTTIQKIEFLIENQLVKLAALDICKKCISGKLDLQKMSEKQRKIYRDYVFNKVDKLDNIS